MMSVTEKYKVFCADLAARRLGAFEELLNTPVTRVEELRATSILQQILGGD